MEETRGVKIQEIEGRILVIDDEWTVRDILQTILVAEGYQVECAEDGAMGMALLDKTPFDIIITDLNMPGVGSAEIIEHFGRVRPGGASILTTGMGAREAVETAIRIGAQDALVKPFNFEHLKQMVARAREMQRVKAENLELRKRLGGLLPGQRELIGHSQAVASLRHVIRTVAASDSTVLMIGESGSGRELAAREVHRQSARAEKPWIIVNCAAIPDEMMEAEMFGAADRPGWFGKADGGTVYLDGITELTSRIQSKLLGVLEERRIYPVGGEARTVDVRVIASAQCALEEAVDDGSFRRDLYYRLNVIPVHVPALRERREDIPLLLAHFADERSRRDGRPPVSFSESALACLTGHDWPGNLREMMNFVERMALLHSGRKVEMRDLPESHRAARVKAAARSIFEQTEGSVDFNHLVDEYERALIDLALRKARGVKNHAASLLKLKRTTLVEKMKKKKIKPNPYADLSQSDN